MRLNAKNILIGFAVYEVVAYAFNSWQVSKPSAAGQAVFTLPFDFISTLMGGYATASNPVAGLLSGQGPPGGGVRGYTGAPLIRLPTRPLMP